MTGVQTCALPISQNLYDDARAGQERADSEGRRSILQIRIDILRVISQGYGKPTQIMYRANLSWNVLQSQLKSFLEGDMITVESYGSRRKYLITQKGMDVISSYQKVVDQVLA